MAFSFSFSRTASAAVLGAAIVGSTLAPTVARADHWRHHHHDHGGAVAAGVGIGVLGVAAGLAAANARDRDEECWYERRRYVNRYGDVTYRRIQVCE